MSKHHKWYYADAGSCSVGTMICTGCHKEITEGPFRYRETEEAYLPQHRACCASDPKWAEMDNHQCEVKDRSIKLLVACKEFKRKWGIDALDELIDYLAETQEE